MQEITYENTQAVYNLTHSLGNELIVHICFENYTIFKNKYYQNLQI